MINVIKEKGNIINDTKGTNIKFQTIDKKYVIYEN